VDFLPKEDVMEWLLNLEKYSKIKDYTLTEELDKPMQQDPGRAKHCPVFCRSRLRGKR
jgi:hypothetical protein